MRAGFESHARRNKGGMADVTCAECGQLIGADLYIQGIDELVSLCVDCALDRMRSARER